MSPIVIVPVIESEEKIKVNIVGRKYLIIVRVVTLICVYAHFTSYGFDINSLEKNIFPVNPSI